MNWAISYFGDLASKSDTAAILAIGSAVRATHHFRSDVDFVVITNGDLGPEFNQMWRKSLEVGAPCSIRLSFHTRTSTIRMLSAPDPARPIEVDLHLFRCGDVEQKLQEGDDQLGWAIRFGRAIFDRDQFWASLRPRWIRQLPLPAPEVADARALFFGRAASKLISTGHFEAALEEKVVKMLTHQARARLIRARIYPASRPELPMQLRKIGEHHLAESLEYMLRHQQIPADILEELKRTPSEQCCSRYPG
jgi:hypothetical protein